MLKKLFKYDWKSFWKVPAIINISLLILTLIGVLSLLAPIWKLDHPIMGPLIVSAVMLYYIAIFAGTIGVTVYIAIRFYKNLYTDEGYLTHTLPVTPRNIILSKIFVSSIWSLITGLVVCISVFLIFFTALSIYGGDVDWVYGFRIMWDEINKFVVQQLNMSMFGVILFLTLYTIISMLFSILMIYSSIALGQLFTKHKVMGAVIWYIAEYTVVQFIGSLLMNLNLPFMLNTDSVAMLKIMKPSMIGSLVFYTLATIFFFFITEYIVKKKLNLD